VADYHFARGVTPFQLRAGGGFGGSAISWYVNRLGYCSHRTAAAQVRCITHQQRLDGGRRLHRRHLSTTEQLLEHQIDFDYLDEQVLTTVGTLDGGGLKNLSGQVYRGIVIPSRR